MKKMAVAFLFVSSFSISHAQECTPPADQYIGIDVGDGNCHPWPKKWSLPNGWPCKPELKGRMQSPLLTEIVNGEFVETKECVPIELLRRFDPPRSTSLDDLQRSVDQLKDEVEQLEAESEASPRLAFLLSIIHGQINN